MIRVLHIVQRFRPGGGIDRFVLNCIEKGDHTLFQHDVLTHDAGVGEYVEQAQKYGSNIYTLPPLGLSTLSINEKNFAHIIGNNNYQIIHCHMANAAFLYLGVAQRMGIPLRVLHSHQDRYADVWSHVVRNIPLVLLGKRKANLFLACSHEAGRFLFRQKKYIIIRNGIDTRKFQFQESKRKALRQKLKIDNAVKVVLFLGRLTPQKNPMFALNVFNNLLSDSSMRWRMLIAGDGELSQSLQRAVVQQNLVESAILLGEVEDVPSLLAAADILIMPSLYEGFGYSAIEAQASGLPCLISDRFPDEIKKTELINSLSLDMGAEIWAENLRVNVCQDSSQNIFRTSYASIIKDAGFDSERTVSDLEHVYISNL